MSACANGTWKVTTHASAWPLAIAADSRRPAGEAGIFNRRQSKLLSGRWRRKIVERLAIWQRNGGVTSTGLRISRGWGMSMLRCGSKLSNLLEERGIECGLGWESRLLSAGDLGPSGSELVLTRAEYQDLKRVQRST